MPSLKASDHEVSDDFRGVHDLNFDLFICDTFGLIRPGLIMNNGKTLFAQVMEFIPWKSFSRIVDRRNADSGVRTLSCADIFRVMAFAQLTWRESFAISKSVSRPIVPSCTTWVSRAYLTVLRCRMP